MYIIKAGRSKEKFIMHPLPEHFQLAPTHGIKIRRLCAASVVIVSQKTFVLAMKHLQNSFWLAASRRELCAPRLDRDGVGRPCKAEVWRRQTLWKHSADCCIYSLVNKTVPPGAMVSRSN